ncbi:4459_t:CDS:2 [Dentiscutata erythropus]|uniref:4459_t:CDS:1 n=1 Tax=Dentiscutata erythropus TaxID=1348616 RepID=A0A9N9GT67_9GLOM|nr:4459_t:CDS:2 [Dentiscutata erythropus]
MSLDRNVLSEEFSLLILKLTNACEGRLTNIAFDDDGKIVVTRNFSGKTLRSKKQDDIVKTELDINEIQNDHGIESSKKKKRKYKDDNSKQSSLLSQILNEVNDDDPENAWTSINAILETIFGRDQILKSPNDESKSKYLNLIFELQDCHEALKPIQTMDTSQKQKSNEEDLIILLIKKVKWEEVANNLKKVNNSSDNSDETTSDSTLTVTLKATNSDITSIKNDLDSWRNKYNKYNDLKRSIKIEKLKHFVSLKQHYINLFYAATQKTPCVSKSLPSKSKFEQSNPLGNNPPQKILRGWISHHISSTLLVSKRTERKIWNSLCLLVALLSNSNENINYKPFLQIGNDIENDAQLMRM